MIGPNWFACVMGTGIVATATATLPVHVPGLHVVATGVWALSAALLVVLLVAFARHGTSAADDPVLVQFWGAPPMALMTVGAGTLLVGGEWPFAVAVAATLWAAGTLLGLGVAVLVPYRMMVRGDAGRAFGGWLMPLVPPMVSAATGALLVPHVPFGRDLLLICGALWGVSLLGALLTVGRIWSGLLRDGPGAPGTVPTMWIVLGPVGQSVTALHLLANAATGVLPARLTTAASLLPVLYGVPVLGFALFWLALSAAVTLRTARAGLPFAMTWWSFTFPLGTVVTAAGGLATRTGSGLLTGLAVVLHLGLVGAWATVAARTVRELGSLLAARPREEGAQGGGGGRRPLGDDVGEGVDPRHGQVEAAGGHGGAELHQQGAQVVLDGEGVAVARAGHDGDGDDAGQAVAAVAVEERLQQARVRGLVRGGGDHEHVAARHRRQQFVQLGRGPGEEAVGVPGQVDVEAVSSGAGQRRDGVGHG